MTKCGQCASDDFSNRPYERRDSSSSPLRRAPPYPTRDCAVSFVVSPHAQDLDRVFGVIDLIHKTLLNVDAAGIGPGQISNKIFVGRRILKWVLGDHVEKTLGL